ncbi:hypothetical protein [Marinomonas sp. PE14-40]|uniref:hypothetical protein n=1 Tax=Marinomonas sp. PE14-40 TaxID=3060621 RepID=UPI003F671EA6
MIIPKKSTRKHVKLLLLDRQLNTTEARDLFLLDKEELLSKVRNYYRPRIDYNLEMISDYDFTWLESLDINALLITNLLIRETHTIDALRKRFTPEFELYFNVNEGVGEKIRFEKSTCLDSDLSRKKLICNVVTYFDLELNQNILLKEAHLKLLKKISIEIYNNTRSTFNWINQELKQSEESLKFEIFQWFSKKLKNKSHNSITEYINNGNMESLLNLLVVTSYISHSNEGFELKYRKIKSAWSSKKNRDSNNDKKACSFMLSTKTIELLDKLSKQNRRKKNEMLEILIEDSWLNMKNEKKAD